MTTIKEAQEATKLQDTIKDIDKDLKDHNFLNVYTGVDERDYRYHIPTAYPRKEVTHWWRYHLKKNYKLGESKYDKHMWEVFNKELEKLNKAMTKEAEDYKQILESKIEKLLYSPYCKEACKMEPVPEPNLFERMILWLK